VVIPVGESAVERLARIEAKLDNVLQTLEDTKDHEERLLKLEYNFNIIKWVGTFIQGIVMLLLGRLFQKL
jgi:hypothetical protein